MLCLLSLDYRGGGEVMDEEEVVMVVDRRDKERHPKVSPPHLTPSRACGRSGSLPARWHFNPLDGRTGSRGVARLQTPGGNWPS